ncbi:MAG: amino-acid N-acetyltransferase [Gemmataceae bacterium]|nr:amino-acid N-acetyltransferase [Gemmataceae bacterium]MDW8267309.1 amino-acid N-acetyltransferase [Gemmataceae bacterium]
MGGTLPRLPIELAMLRLTDLREILRYVPHFRDKLFIIAVDGAIVEDENFGNLLLDIALLRSLRIGVVLVHGAGQQIRRLAEQTGQTPSNLDGTGITDAATLQLAITAANRVTHEILEGLSATDLRGACGNAVVAHPAGILQGVNHLYTGRVERVDTVLLQALLERDIVPVVPPLGCDGEGQTYRLNSDAVAVDVARALKAVKLVYLTTCDGVRRHGELLRQVSVEEAEVLLKKHRAELGPSAVLSKFTQALRAAREGVPRVHIIDGRVEEGLLAEVFSNEGIGTLIHTNEYQAIRPAQKKDVRAIAGLIETGVANDELLRRTRAELERQIGDFFVLEVDRNPVACMAVHSYPGEGKAELACVCVDTRYENQGIGMKLIQYAESQARLRGARELFCLSTQAVNYFVQKGGFRLGTPDDLPPERRERYERSGRRSQVLVKKL